jgi:hypothetical protein
VVLAEHTDIQDTDLGSYTVKVYESERVTSDDGRIRLHRVIMRPDSTDATYQPLVLQDLPDGELRIIAEMVEVLR